MTTQNGTLYLIPVPLGINAPIGSIPDETRNVIGKLEQYLVENAKTARAYLKQLSLPVPIQKIEMRPLTKNPSAIEIQEVIALLKKGVSIGMLSEAGCPAVADPGSIYVFHAHLNGITVVPLVGPSSIMLALMASGLHAQQFTFIGYVPADPIGRKGAINAIGRTVSQAGVTHIIIETPYRNNYLLSDIIATLPSFLAVTIAVNLTTDQQLITTKLVSDWKKDQSIPDLSNKQTVFLIGMPYPPSDTTSSQSRNESSQSPVRAKYWGRKRSARRKQA